jgi:hypothetical protein
MPMRFDDEIVPITTTQAVTDKATKAVSITKRRWRATRARVPTPRPRRWRA